MRRFLAGVLVAGLVLPSRGAAGQEAAVDVVVQADALVAGGDPGAAARLLREELARTPEDEEHRARRGVVAGRALAAFTQAFTATGDCAGARVGITVADEYLAQLEAVHGPGARDSAEYVDVRDRRERLEQARGEHGCLKSAAFAAKPASETAPEPLEEPPPSPSPEARATRVVPLVVLATLTATALAVSLGTGLSRVQSPFHGRAFARIDAVAAASRGDDDGSNDVAAGSAKQMCATDNRFRNAELDDACAQWRRFGTTSIIAGVAAGVLAIGTAALAGSQIKRRRQARNLRVGVGPRPDGVAFSASLAF